MSGARFFVLGVGTQMISVSGSHSRLMSSVAQNRFVLTISAMDSCVMCLIGLRPLLIRATILELMSNPSTVAPPRQNSCARGSPTYPRPMIPT